MFTIISFFQKIIKRGFGTRARELENFSKIDKLGGGGRLFGTLGYPLPFYAIVSILTGLMFLAPAALTTTKPNDEIVSSLRSEIEVCFTFGKLLSFFLHLSILLLPVFQLFVSSLFLCVQLR